MGCDSGRWMAIIRAEAGGERCRRHLFWLGMVAACVCFGFLAASLAVARLGGLAYDDANYLERGLYHARQIGHRPAWQWPIRLPYSLTFEGPKPPFFHGWLAATALVLGGKEHVELWVGFSVGVPWALLCLLVAWGIRSWSVSSVGIALGALHGMPGLVALMPLAMVEVWLAVWVLAALLLLEWWFERPTPLRAGVFGVAVGLAFLTKLTAGMFLVPGLLAALLVGYQMRLLNGQHWATLPWSIPPALLFAGPWYANWGLRAWEFGHWSANWEAWAISRPWWVRTLELPLEVVGPLLLVATGLLLWSGAGKLSCFDKHQLSTLLFASVPALLFVSCQLNSDPRFWAAGLGWLPVVLARYWEQSRTLIGRTCSEAVSIAALFLVVIAAASSVSRGWREATSASRTDLRQLAQFLKGEIVPKAPNGVLCTLGGIPHWNPYGLRFALELAGLGRQLQVLELTRQPDVRAVAASCDVVFRLRAEEIPLAQPEQVANRPLLQAGEFSLAAAGFELLPEDRRPYGLFLPSEVWLRVKR